MIRRHKVLYDSDAAGTGSWIRLDSRREIDNTRAITIKMNASDTIAIQGTVIDAIDATALVAKYDSTKDVVTLEEYTGETDVDAVLQGNYTFIRAVKTGTAGNAKVQGYL